MKPLLLSTAVLAASLSVGAGASPAPRPAPCAPGDTTCAAAAAPASVAPAALSSADRAELRAVEQRDADLSQVKAGFFLDDHDTILVLATIGIVVLIALLL